MTHRFLRTKPVSRLLAETQQEGRKLKKALTAWDLTAIGIGCIIGVGIFVLPGVEAAKHAGPGIILSFAPFGLSGIMTAAAIVFLAYVGFDAVSTTAEEAVKPQRDLPIGIIASLVVATTLYIAVAAIMTGIVPYQKLGVADPIALVLNTLNMPWASALISVGAVAGITSVLLVLLMGQPRIIFAMSRDGLLPKYLAEVHPKYQTPHRTTWMTGIIVATAAALTPIGVVAELCSIGTLFAFIIVCAGVIVLRIAKPEIPRPFRAPWTPFLPGIGMVLCFALMVSLPVHTWIRFIVWMALGLVVYWLYGSRHSTLNREAQRDG